MIPEVDGLATVGFISVTLYALIGYIGKYLEYFNNSIEFSLHFYLVDYILFIQGNFTGDDLTVNKNEVKAAEFLSLEELRQKLNNPGGKLLFLTGYISYDLFTVIFLFIYFF